MYTRITDSDNRFGEFTIIYKEKEEFRILFHTKKIKKIIHEFIRDKNNFKNHFHFPKATFNDKYSSSVVFKFSEAPSHLYLFDENNFVVYYQINNRPLAEKMFIPKKYLSTYILWKEDIL